MITIYGTKLCDYCKKAVNLCEDNDILYEYHDITYVETSKALARILHTTVPVIAEDGVLIGGYNDLLGLISSRNALDSNLVIDFDL